MSMPLELIAILYGIAIFFAVIAGIALFHSARVTKRSGSAWLFDNWELQLYEALFSERDPLSIGKKIGMDVEKYTHNCKLTHQADRTKQVIIDKLCGFAIVAVGCLVGVFMRNPIVMVVGLVIAFPFIALPIHFVESAAEKRRFVVADELPRFLDMLHTALIMGFPVDQAIEITAQNLRGTILAEELLKTLAETKVGAYSWQEALERLASMYGVDTLSDFVLDITNAYKLGSSITESVARKSKDIKQSNLVAMKERASKLTNTILFPILFFKIVPIIALMGVPIVVQLQATGF
jgi:tight adherence protein C